MIYEEFWSLEDTPHDFSTDSEWASEGWNDLIALVIHQSLMHGLPDEF